MSTPGRIEIKYLVPLAQLHELIRGLAGYLNPDSYAPARGYYRVSSTYFDSLQFAAALSKEDGNDPRIKLRLRAYDDDARTLFLESKFKRAVNVHKLRLKFDAADLASLQAGNLPAYKPQWKRSDYDFFDYLWNRIHFEPAVVVAYDRYPFVSPVHPTLRITLDTHNRYAPASRTLLGSDFPERYFIPPHLAILEIKSSSGLPRWVLKLIEHYAIEPIAISKYLLAMTKYSYEFNSMEGTMPCLNFLTS